MKVSSASARTAMASRPMYLLGLGKARVCGSQENALVGLVRRYLAAYRPARSEDLAAWSGSSVREARTAWKLVGADLAEVRITGQPAWILNDRFDSTRESADQTQIVCLLPNFDAYLLGYRNRDLALALRYTRRIQRGDWLHPTVIVNGQVVSTWSYNDRRKWQNVVVEPFEELDPAIVPRQRTSGASSGRAPR